MRTQIILAGSGGQGIQFAGQVLARAAMDAGFHSTYVPNYGAERRGGTSFCSVVISDNEIFAPVFQVPDVLVAFDQRGRKNYSYQLNETGIILANQNLAAQTETKEKAKVVLIPATQLAEEVCGSIALNLAMIGAYAAMAHQISIEVLKKTLTDSSAKKPQWLENNLEALSKGYGYINRMSGSMKL
jgi:2-oxoacid:acceptor oxidoreductase gamma subunit (pyruvate/2-ketoisovalerate family)